MLQHFSEFGNVMDEYSYSTKLSHGSHYLPALVVVEHHALTRTCILGILKREFAEFDIVELTAMSDLTCVSGRDIRLVTLNIGDKPITDPSVVQRLARLEELCPGAPVALLSSRSDEDTASAAMQRGVRGFFSTSIPVEVAIAGLRLVLAGGVYRPLPIVNQNETPALLITTCADLSGPVAIANGNRSGNGRTKDLIEGLVVELTPREQQVLEGLELGLPNKLIAARLNLSENTVKMHIQHIMRKCSAHNRTEAVLRCSGRLSGRFGHA
jgi:DNA-binding NarL/FixJ family response regulator